eukprot:Em0005g357a
MPDTCGGFRGQIGFACRSSTLSVTPETNGSEVKCYNANYSAFELLGSANVQLMPATQPPVISLEQSCSDITVHWNPSSMGGDPSSYNVSVWSGMTVVGAVSVIAMGTITYYHTFTGLRSDVLYMVKVIASNCAGSNEVNATIWTYVPSFIQMASINSVGLIGPYSQPVESNSPSNCYLYVTISALQNTATFQCIFLDGQEHYCLFNCSSEQFAPYSHSNITKSGLVVFGVLNGLTSGHRYYCRAAAVNDAMAVSNENESMTMHINFSTLSTIKIRPQIDMKVAIMFQDLTTAVINCTFLARQSHYCLICCSDEVNMTTFPIGNISASKGLKVTAQLSGLEDKEIYYCTATGTDDGASMCNTGNTELLEIILSTGTTVLVIALLISALCYKIWCCRNRSTGNVHYSSLIEGKRHNNRAMNFELNRRKLQAAPNDNDISTPILQNPEVLTQQMATESRNEDFETSYDTQFKMNTMYVEFDVPEESCVQNAHNMQNDDGKKKFNLKTESASYQFQILNMPVVRILWDEQTQTMQQGIPTGTSKPQAWVVKYENEIADSCFQNEQTSASEM